MYARSARFDAAVVDSHEVAIHAALWSPGLTELLADDLDVLGGEVTASRTATHRRSCNVDLVDRDGTLASIFSSTQTVPPVELIVKRGIHYPDGTELLPLGVFPVVDVTVTGRVQYSLSASDRSWRVAREGFTQPYIVPVGVRYAVAAGQLIQSRLPYAGAAQIVGTAPDLTVSPVVATEQDDPWTIARKLAGSAGCDIYYDQLGTPVVDDIPSTSGGHVDWQYVDGETSILLPGTTQKISAEPGYNGVLVIGEGTANTSTVPRFLAVDDNPRSMTYFWGRYGQVVETVTDATATTVARAELMARARLRRHLGRNDSMDLATVPHPAHDPGDVVRVKWYDRDQLMIVDTVRIPLDAESTASLSVRSQISTEAT